jgi:hypothetical protein
MIVLPNGYKIEIIGSESNLLKTMFLDFFDGREIDGFDEIANLFIFLGLGSRSRSRSRSAELIFSDIDLKLVKHKELNLPNPDFLVAVLSKKDFEFVKSFCVKNKLKMYIASPKKVYQSYSFLKFTIYEYICIALGMSAKALAKNSLKNLPKNSLNSSNMIVNIDDQLLSAAPEKNFNLRYTHINNFHFLYEPGTNSKDIRLSMEWMQQQIIDKTKTSKVEVHTIIDLDSIPSDTESVKDYLIFLTILGIYQKSFFIVNSSDVSLDSSEESEEFRFDYNIYTSMMELWNSKAYIPQRKMLANVPEPGYESLRSESFIKDLKALNDSIDFELSIRKPPIFILDSLDSIKESLNSLKDSKEFLILYIGKKENFEKIIN